MTKIEKKRKKESNPEFEHPFFALEDNHEGAIDSVLSG